MKWKKLLSGAGILGVCAAAAKLIGAFFRIPLTNILGAEGIGLYQMVFPLYTVLLTISSGGLSGAISKAVALQMVRNDEKSALKILKVSIAALSILGGVAAAFLVIFRGRIAAVQGNSAASLAYLGIAPAVVFVGVISCLRGYFQGRGNMLPSGISQIAEQLIKLVFGLFFARLLLSKGIELAVLGAVLGITLSELFAMLLLLAQFFTEYFRTRKSTKIDIKSLKAMTEAGEDFVALTMVSGELSKQNNLQNSALNSRLYNKQKSRLSSKLNSKAAIFALKAPPYSGQIKTSDILKSLYKIAIPITLGMLIMPLSQAIDSVMVINVLISGGMSRIEATSLFGLISGPISSLINMPIAIMLSISVALLPRLAYLREKSKNNALSDADSADNEQANIKQINEKSINSSTKNPISDLEVNAKYESPQTDESFNISQTTNTKQISTPSDAATGALKITLLLALPAASVFMAFSSQIVQMLYSNGLSEWQLKTASSLLKIESLSIFYISVIQIATAVLQSADKPHRPAINLLYGAVTKVLLTLALLPLLGIRGAAAASVVCYAVIAIIDLVYMRKIVSLRLNRLKAVVLPLIGCGIMVALAYGGLWAFGLFLRPLYATVAGLVVGGIGYAVFLLITKSVSIKEIFG